MYFADSEVHRAYENNVVGLHARIKVRIEEFIILRTAMSGMRLTCVETTVGRALLAEIRP